MTRAAAPRTAISRVDHADLAPHSGLVSAEPCSGGVAKPLDASAAPSADSVRPASTCRLTGGFASGGGIPTSCNAAAPYPRDDGRMPLRCLLVDDNDAFLEAARILLQREGVTVVGVSAPVAPIAYRETLALILFAT